jgi:hypothetical protein
LSLLACREPQKEKLLGRTVCVAIRFSDSQSTSFDWHTPTMLEQQQQSTHINEVVYLESDAVVRSALQ